MAFDMNSYILWIILWAIICGGIGGTIGSSKGRAFAGFFWGALLGPIGWLLIAVGPNMIFKCKQCGIEVAEGREMCRQCAIKSIEIKKAESQERKCPFCAEIIKKDAIICKHCKSSVEPGKPQESLDSSKNKQESESMEKLYGYLKVATSHGNMGKVISVLNSNPELIIYKSSGGWSLLHYAVYWENIEAIDYLIANGMSVDIQDADEYTPLHRALIDKHYKIVSHLINKGADVNIKAKDGLSVLERAAKMGNKYASQLLDIKETRLTP